MEKTETKTAFDLMVEDLDLTSKSGKFESKLSVPVRCAIYALHTVGFHRRVLSEMFSIHDRTVGHIVNPASQHYKGVRNMYQSMGRQTFHTEYLTAELVKKASRVLEAQRKSMAKPITKHESSINPRSNQKEGKHTLPSGRTTEIEWHDEEQTEDGIVFEGWFYFDPVTSGWIGPHKSSTAAYKAALEEVG